MLNCVESVSGMHVNFDSWVMGSGSLFRWTLLWWSLNSDNRGEGRRNFRKFSWQSSVSSYVF